MGLPIRTPSARRGVRGARSLTGDLRRDSPSAAADRGATARVRRAFSVYPSSPRHSFYPAGFALPLATVQQSVAAVSPTSSPSRTSGAFAAPATDADNAGERLCGGNSERPASFRISRIGNDVKQYSVKPHPVQEGRKSKMFKVSDLQHRVR
nr:uncharacterized protein LOC109770458 [Aegilops tauschii subsp. strangulata]